ncbi:MAG: 23S rRNA (adenine(2503)-C(2))-methyltransferase RlmN [Tissierellia bacterium]|nr:23S rRNA (adenine(2503)-C(2))-methyltransferase RlmN [Tissierellia bacterium]
MNILGLTCEEFMELDLGLPKFRYKQIFEGLHKGGQDYKDITSLPLALREQLAEDYPLPVVVLKEAYISEKDDTRKLILELEDGNIVEAVLMSYRYGWTLCTPSQVGCAMGCTFCASTIGGLVRNLTRAEMLKIFYVASNYIGEISRVVFMGSGEPLHNYEEVLGYIRLLGQEEGRNLSMRNISLSTCGLVEGINRLAEEGLPITLTISLHAPNDRVRQITMPIARTTAMDDLLEAASNYQNKTGRRVSIEYTLIEGLNNSLEHAKELGARLKGKGFHVNLISVNPLEERDFQAPERHAMEIFKKELEASKINVTIRRELGSDISGSCGQLRNRYVELKKRS